MKYAIYTKIESEVYLPRSIIKLLVVNYFPQKKSVNQLFVTYYKRRKWINKMEVCKQKNNYVSTIKK